jgi:hypothetical protein
MFLRTLALSATPESIDLVPLARVAPNTKGLKIFFVVLLAAVRHADDVVHCTSRRGHAIPHTGGMLGIELAVSAPALLLSDLSSLIPDP